jgi:hypothetical protein
MKLKEEKLFDHGRDKNNTDKIIIFDKEGFIMTNDYNKKYYKTTSFKFVIFTRTEAKKLYRLLKYLFEKQS